MNNPSDKSATGAKLPDTLDVVELSDQQLDGVTGGAGKAGTGGVKPAPGVSAADESPKETVTFEYGGLSVHYSQQLPD